MTKSIFDDFFDTIVKRETPIVDKIMSYMAHEIQKDFVNETYRLLDIYYENYTRPPRIYIRTDELKSQLSKSNRLRGKGGRFTTPNKTIRKRLTDRSLMEAMKTPGSFGVARLNEQGNGYIGGIIFDPDDESYQIDMTHSVAGIEEFDMVRNFLFSDDASLEGNMAATNRSFPSADSQLQKYLMAYDGKIDKLYSDACRKFR